MAKRGQTKRIHSFADGVGRALRSAARAARKTAQMHGTPIYIWKDGKVVAVKPKPPLSRYALGRQLESFVRKELASGRYSSATEVIVDGLKLLEKSRRKRRRGQGPGIRTPPSC